MQLHACTTIVLLTVLAAALTPSGAVAETIIPIAQERSVSAFADGFDEYDGQQSDSDSESATSFGPFAGSASAGVGGFAGASASQISTIGSEMITARGEASSSGESSFCPPHSGGGDGDSQFSLTFEIPTETPYFIEGYLASVRDRLLGGIGASFSLTGPVGFEAITRSATATSVAPILVRGVLPPGVFTLELSAGSDVNGNNAGTSRFDIQLHLASPDPVATLSSLEPTSQTRFIEVSAAASCPSPGGFESDSDSDASKDFGPFNSSVSVGADAFLAGAGALALQDSRIGDGFIVANGRATTSSSAETKGSCSANGSGSSDFEVSFMLESQSTVELLAVVAGSTVSLSPAGPSISGVDRVHQTYELPPGLYTLAAEASVSAGAPFCINQAGEQGAYFVELAVNAGSLLCDGDVNGDSYRDVQDLTAVILNWGECESVMPQLCPWDLNGDGLVGVQDLVAIILEWGDC